MAGTTRGNSLKVEQFRGKTANLATLNSTNHCAVLDSLTASFSFPSEIKYGATLTIMYSEKI